MPTLREIRKYRRMSQKEVAKKAGIDRITYGRNERGTQKPLSPTLQSIADALAVDVADIEFPQWPEDYVNELQLSSDLKRSSQGQAETEEGDPPEGTENEAEEIVVTDERIAKKMESPPKPTEEPQPEPKPESEPGLPSTDKAELEPEPDPRVEMVQTTPPPIPSPVPFFLSLGKWGIIILLIGIAIGCVILWKQDQKKNGVASPSKEGVKTSSGDPVRDFLDNY